MDIKDSYLHGTIGVVKSISVDADKLKYTLADIAGTVKEVTLPVATQTANGLMSSSDKTKLDNLSTTLGNYVTLNTDQEITGIKTFTKQQKFTVAKGTAPFQVTSDTRVDNLNASKLDGYGPNTFVKQLTKSFESRTELFQTINDYKGDHLVSIKSVSWGNLLNLAGQDWGTGLIYSQNAFSDTSNILGGGIWINYSGTQAYLLKLSGNTSDNSITTDRFITNSMLDSITVSSASTADKLKTKRKLWGQDFDGSADVSGALSGVTAVIATESLVLRSSNGNVYIRYNNDDNSSICLINNALMPTTSSHNKLHLGKADNMWKSVYAETFYGNLSWDYITNKPTSFTPAAHTHNELTWSKDTRNVETQPSDYKNVFRFVGIKSPSTVGLTVAQAGQWVSLMGWKGYVDNSGPYSWELASSNKERLFVRSGVGVQSSGSGDESWEAWHTIAYTTDNFPSNQINVLTGYNKASELSALTTTDSLNSALGKLEYKADTAYDWITSVTASDTDKYINKWQEILDFLNKVDDTDGANLTDEFVTRKTNQTILGEKTFQNRVIISNENNKLTTIYTEPQTTNEADNAQTVIQGGNFTHKLVLKDSFAGGCNYATLSGGYQRDGSLTLTSFNVDTSNNTATQKAQTIISTGNSTFAGDVKATKFTVEKNNNSPSLVLVKNSKGQISLQVDSNRGIYDHTSNNWLIGATIDSNNTFLNVGKVGVGTTFPKEKLHVNGNVLANAYITQGGTSDHFVKGDGSLENNVYYHKTLEKNKLSYSDGTKLAYTELEYFTIPHTDNSAKPTFILIADLSSWVVGTVTDAHLIGTIYGHRGYAGQRTVVFQICAQATSYSTGTTQILYTDIFNAQTLQPYIVNYNGINYLALKKINSAGKLFFIGKTQGLLDTFIQVECPNSTDLPEGLTILHSPEYNKFAIAATQLYNGTGPHYILHSGNYTNWAPSKIGVGASGTWNINITGDAKTIDNLGITDLVRHVKGTLTGSSLKYVKLGTLPINNSNNHASFVIKGTVGGYTDKSVVNIAIRNRDTIAYTGSIQNHNSEQWDIGVNDSREIYLILPVQYCAWSLSLHTVQGTIEYSTSATPTDTNWRLLSSSQNVLRYNNEGVVDNSKNGAFYINGTGSAAGVWLGEHNKISSYYEGLTIAYKIPIEGSSATSLNINGLGARYCYLNTQYLTTEYQVGNVVLLVYDGTYFRAISTQDRDSQAYVRQYESSDNKTYPLLFRYNTQSPSSGAYVTEYTRYKNTITFNPYTDTLKAPFLDGALLGNHQTNVDVCCIDKSLKFYTQIIGCEETDNHRYAGTENSYGFPVSTNANGLLWLGTHQGNYGHQLGFSSDGNIYHRRITNGNFPTIEKGGSWKQIAYISDIPSLNDYVTLSTEQTITGKKCFQDQLLVKKDVGVAGDSVLNLQHNLQLQVMRDSDTHSVAIGVMPNGSGVIMAKAQNIGYNTLYLNPQASQAVVIGSNDPTLPNKSGYKFYVYGNSLFNSAITSYSDIYANGGLLKITKNTHTTRIGSINSDFCHFETTAPLYHFNKGLVVEGEIQGTKFAGPADSANKLTTARKITLGEGVTSTATAFDGSADITIPIKSIKESYLAWGDKNIAGDLGVIDNCFSNFNMNKLSFMDADDIQVEYSNDGGVTWHDYGATNEEKTKFVTTRFSTSFYLGHSQQQTLQDRLRVTITATQQRLYFQTKKILIYWSTNGALGCQVVVEKAHCGNDSNFAEIGTYALKGWSGWNSIPLDVRFGGADSQNANVRKLRFTCSFTSFQSGYESRAQAGAYRLYMFGSNSWNNPSTLSEHGSMYNVQIDKSVTFPNRVVSQGFVKTGSSNNYVLLGGGGHTVLSDLTPSAYYWANVQISKTSNENTTPIFGATTIKNVLKITNTSGTQYLLMGNQDSNGVDKPSGIQASNGSMAIGHGDSWTSPSAGNFTKIMQFSSESVISHKPLVIAETYGQYISGMTNAAIKYANLDNAPNTQYHSILAIKTYSGNIMNIGMWKDNVGFYGFNSDNTVNSHNYYFICDTTTGSWKTNKYITASKFIKAGVTNESVLLGDGGHAKISSLSVYSSERWTTPRNLTVGNLKKSVDGSVDIDWDLHGILYNTSVITAETSWDITTPGVYGVSASSFTGTGNPEVASGDLSPYHYGQLIVSRSGNEGMAQFYISHRDSDLSTCGIKFRTGYNNTYVDKWSTILDSTNYKSYTVGKDGTGATGTWNISITGNASTASTSAKLTSITVVSSKTFNLANTEWTDTDFNFTNLATGTYAIQVTSGTNLVASGIMSVYKNLEDSAGDEIPLHVYSNAGWRPYLRTFANKLQISSNDITKQSRTITIKIAQIL